MSPLAHAVRLVNRNATHRYARIVEQVVDFRSNKRFWRDIDNFRLPAPNRIHRILVIFPIDRRIQENRVHARRVQASDLVLHERNERRDDDRKPLKNQRGNLIAKRLSAASRHNRKRVLFCKHILNNIFLKQPERVVTENRFQNDFRLRADKIHISHIFPNSKFCIRKRISKKHQKVNAREFLKK